ncbi:hypothetical protein [Rhodococcus rhodochrous]|uniref:hypothetical protein n=1 Tax=Rhodococcus rhodochrous TaxID=1829 RepID=UPI00128F4ACD|nr:hypothetical protein [Rhodococcus rhodochrous]
MNDYKLETPSSVSALYAALGEDAKTSRPAFTGDIYSSAQEGKFMLVQHPCALRRGVALLPRLLAVAVKPTNGLPEDWSVGHFKMMPLPELETGNHGAYFGELTLVTPDDVSGARRVAMLSHHGVNLLLQRWIYHNSRVVIPTLRYAEQTFGPFNEADLAQDWVDDRVSLDLGSALSEFDAWLGEQPNGDGVTRRMMLGDLQSASMVRRDARAQVRVLESE